MLPEEIKQLVKDIVDEKLYTLIEELKRQLEIANAKIDNLSTEIAILKEGGNF